MTAAELLRSAALLAEKVGSEATPWDARILLADVLGFSNPLAIDPGREIGAQAQERFDDLWSRRVGGAPVQHLLGRWDFFGRTFLVDERALIPRPETETLVETALSRARQARRILDLGTGSGILAATLALELPASRIVAVDVSLAALALARANLARHGVARRVLLVAGDWLAPIGGPAFDLIVSNPPYLAACEEAGLSATVRDHEPRLALYAGADGLEAIRDLLEAAPRHLACGALFLFEIGYGQASAVEAEVLRRPAWRSNGFVSDLAGIPRVAVVRREG